MQHHSHDEVHARLDSTTTRWGHDWKNSPAYPIEYDQTLFDELFQAVGFTVIKFAEDDELNTLRDEAEARARRFVKMAITNETEVITRDDDFDPQWTAVERDIGRMQTPLPDNTPMPGRKTILDYYPKTESSQGKSKKVPVRIMHENLLYSHKGSAAQQFHWDMHPRLDDSVHDQFW